ncbi:transcriptional regulator [Apilactobacillus ozensis DSM 23829 = JCM 17196]|uniref:Transcriptional regulator n=1 Tax=Apilactobacillus ozensis DSM 23829 = JCM 17196 TaxID=1423781 RepID=A0A0R2AJW1_9LACO|nr:MerR family transcriptional regulator [Apilactobacillus ozensis]KRM67560.1 transcriptional regulator [Apilactobacillus ozensis DSM 23829 = JCM 17196]
MSNLTITEISNKYNINQNTIRYYERIGLLPRVPRQSNGNRYYNDKMQKWLEMLLCLRHSGISIEVLYEYVELLQAGDATLKTRENLLRDQVNILVSKQNDIQKSIDRLNSKIALYNSGEIKKHKSYFEEYEIAKEIEKDNKNKQNLTHKH